jgi:hypothetical protein
MNSEQRRTAALTCYLVAAVLAFFYYVRPLWAWLSWDREKHTLDLGIVRIATRPEFPSDARSIAVGLVIPIVLIAIGRIVGTRRKD